MSLLGAKNLSVETDGRTTDCVRFGRGNRPLVMIPGVGDGLKTVRGMALPFAWLYRELAEDFTVYVFSRPRELREGETTRDMAASLKSAMDALGICPAAVVGVSQGGMIAQWLAIDFPEAVSRLVLTVTLSRPNPAAEDAIGRWIEMACRGDHRGIMTDTAERSYTPERAAREVKLYSLLAGAAKPADFGRFMIQAQSCLSHDAYSKLDRIKCPAMVIGGTEDRIVTGDASREIAERIPDCRLLMYEGLGHGLYEEAKDFLERVSEFCRE